MNKFFGFLLIVLGIILGGYLTLYVMLYGGICQIIDAINPLVAKDIAMGIIKVLLCEIGIIPGYFLAFLGMTLIGEKL